MRLFVVGILAALAAASQVTEQDLQSGPNENWLTYIGDYYGHRYSPLRQIDRDNVERLAPAWVRHIQTQADLESTPLVYRGVMYVTNSNEIYALDAMTGREVWRYAEPGVRRRAVNRGAAVLGDRVFFETSDCHLVALRSANGGLLFDRDFARDRAYSCTGAPLIVKDMIIVGVASSGKTCFISALSTRTGEEVWRFLTVPRKGEPGSATWGKLPLDQGGSPTWTTGTWDATLNLLYWATGNPWPDFYGGDRPGDNLYSDCVLALDPDTGKLKWYFQFVPHDTHDWDANETPVLVDADFQGRPRRLLVEANRNGFYYVLDRSTGEFLAGRSFVHKLNWATGLDSKGRPIMAANMDPSPGGVKVCPSVHGATNYWAPSMNAQLGLFYVVSLEECETYYSSAQLAVPNSGFRGTGHSSIPSEPGEFFLRALDVKTGRMRWEFPMPGPTTMWAGTVATAGNLVFSADDDGDLIAVDAATGKNLWHFYMGSNLKASPIVFAIGGKEYVSIAAGSNVFSFTLPAR